jgi:hypothetical protein
MYRDVEEAELFRRPQEPSDGGQRENLGAPRRVPVPRTRVAPNVYFTVAGQMISTTAPAAFTAAAERQ